MTDKTEWVTVPREWTSEMWSAFLAEPSYPEGLCAALAAAPTPPAQEAQPAGIVTRCGSVNSIPFNHAMVDLPVGAKVYAIPPDAARRITELEAQVGWWEARCDKLSNDNLRATRNIAELEAERDRLQDVLARNGFVRCDIPACNCGSWHARYGYPERMAEIKDALAEAEHPLSNANGNNTLNALRGLIAERDKIREALDMIADSCEVDTLRAAINTARAALGRKS